MKSMCRNIFRHSATAGAVLLAAMAIAGCTAENADVPEVAEGGLTIRFYSAKAETRVDEPGITDYNENRITSLVVGLYDANLEDDRQPGALRIYRGLTAQDSYSCRISLRREEADLLFGSGAVTGATCKVFAVANLSEETLKAIEGTNPSVNQLKALSVTGRFDELQVQPDFVMTGTSVATYSADSGGNSAAGEVPMVRTAAKITLNVKLPANVRESEDSDVYWWPLGGNDAMRVLLNDGVKTATAESVLTPESVIPDANYFDITTRNDNTWGFSNNAASYPDYPWKQTYPFYTYPNYWENSPSEMHRTTLTLIIPWQRGNATGPTETTYETFYYSVPVTPAEVTEIVSNHSYQIDLSVNMLGSRSPEMPEEVEGFYRIVDWQTQSSDVAIKDNRYLIVSPRTYEVNGLDEFTLRFNSSHPVEVEDITMRYNRYAFITNEGSDDIGTVVTFPTSKGVIDRSTSGDYKLVEYTADMDEKEATSKQYVFKLKHELKLWTPVNSADATTITAANTVSQTGQTSLSDSTRVQESIEKYLRPDNPEPVFSPYVFEITLRHKTNHSFRETFTVIQYPDMYITAVRNPGGGPDHHPGNNFVNGYGYINSSSGENSLQGLGSLSQLEGDNRNPNMYVITVSKLLEGSGYYIGDPRSLRINNYLTIKINNNTWSQASLPIEPTESEQITNEKIPGWSTVAPALFDGASNRGLKYYYPTIESNEDYYRMMIAPKFRIASSYGTTGGVDRTNARKRCATYQEYNCPAGRWRLPTYGELLYITTLSAQGKIPTLFNIHTNNNSSSYFCAQGRYRVTVNNQVVTLLEADNTGKAAVRCVYDEWYWEKESNYTISPDGNGHYSYTLGDMPKRNAQD